MKRNNKKGFTIVELTIVIAVIAILAAVLIPTFSSVVDKANQSADIQLIRQANVVLQAATADGSSLSEEAAIKELENNSIKLDKPSQTDCVFYYLESENRYVIFNTKTKKATYPEDLAQELSKKNWLPTYKLTCDWKINHDFVSQASVNTGYKPDWSKNFTIEQTIEFSACNGAVMLFDTLKDRGGSCGVQWAIVNDNGKLVVRNFYSGKEQRYEQELNPGELAIKLDWNATSNNMTMRFKQENKDFTLTWNASNIQLDSNQAFWIGTQREGHKEHSFDPVKVTSFKITTEYKYGEVITNISTPSGNATGYTSGKWENPVSTMPAADTTITAKWGE